VKSRRYRLTLLFVAVLLLAGCVSNISLDKTKTGPIASVALLQVQEPQQFVVRNMFVLPAFGGLIGGLIAEAVESKRARAFLDEYNQGSVRLSAAFVDDLQRELAGGSMQVSYLAEVAPEFKDQEADFSNVQTDKDAILSAWFGPVGYVADGMINAPYQPWVVVNVRLVHGKTKRTLLQKTYTAGYDMKPKGTVFVPCATNYRRDTFDKVMADIANSVAALLECEKAIIRQAAQDLE
jgi:hypothetical protein